MAQNLTATIKDIAVAKATDVWAKNDSFMKSVKPRTEVAKLIIANTTANTTFLQKATCMAVEVQWLQNCTTSVVDNDKSDCEFGGSTIESVVKEYTISKEKSVEFSIDDNLCTNTETFEDLLSKELVKHVTDLDNQINIDLISKVDSFAGTNKYTGETSKATVVGTNTTIKPQFMNLSLMSYFSKVAMINGMDNSYILSGDNMYNAVYNANADAGNSDGKGAVSRAGAFDWSFDLYNFDTILGAKKTLMVSPDSVAFVSYTKFDNYPFKETDSVKRFTVPSLAYSGVTYDVLYKTSCINGGDNDMHDWKIIARYDLFGAPSDTCEAGNTGVLSFTCEA